MLHFKKKFEDFWWIFQKLSRFFVFGISRNAVWSQIGGCSYLGNRTHLRAEIFRVSFFHWYNYVCKISRKSEDPHGDSFVGFCRILGACSLKAYHEDIIKQYTTTDNRPSDASYAESKSFLESHFDKVTQGAILRSKCTLYEDNEKSSKYFLNLEKKRGASNTVKKLVKNDTDIV